MTNMQNNEKYIEKINEFNKKYPEDCVDCCLRLRRKFVKDFDKASIISVTLEDYVIGNGNENSFCFRLKKELIRFGETRRYTNSNFGVYYSKGKYCYKKEYGNYNEALADTREKICNLIKLGEMQKYSDIDELDLAPLLKAKILAVYMPNDYLSILSPEHVNHFIKVLNIDDKNVKGNESKKQLLLEYKNKNEIMKKWHNLAFVWFLYELADPRK